MPEPIGGGRRIVLAAPLTEIIDHAGYFIQMGVASMPKGLEFIFNRSRARPLRLL